MTAKQKSRNPPAEGPASPEPPRKSRADTVLDPRSPSARSRQLERIVKGFANHWRIEILELLVREPELSLGQIANRLKMDIKTASEHVRRLAISGLVLKRYEGREVRHCSTPRGQIILTFLRKLE